MGINDDDRDGAAKSFDFAKMDATQLNDTPDLRFERTTVDPMAVHKKGVAPNLSNSSSLTGSNMSMPPDPYDENLVGLHIAQNYEILEKVGEGGMSAVYRARHMHLNREVAVKMLHPHLVSNRISRERFSQEARAVSQIEHPNVVRLLDFGITEENRPYIVMDFLRGSSLSQTVKQKGPLDIDSAVPIFIQICDALAYTHDKGIVHRDLKPSNVILIAQRQRSKNSDDGDADGGLIAKIVDFGIAKLSPHEDAGMAALTQTGDVFGSPLYMSPEQAKGDKLDSRADIYSMGCLMYESLTGVPPINGTNMLEILYRHMNEMPKPMNAVMAKNNTPVPRSLEAIVFKALAKEPQDRYQDMRSLSRDLTRFVDSGQGFFGSLASTWSLYRSRRLRLNMREKIAMTMTLAAVSAIVLCGATFVYLYFQGMQDFSSDRTLTWLTPAQKSTAPEYYDPSSHLVNYSLKATDNRINEMRAATRAGHPEIPTENDYDLVQDLFRNATELSHHGNLEAASSMFDKMIELGTYVHGGGSQIVRQAIVLQVMLCYELKKYAQCISLIEQLQKEVSPATLYEKAHMKGILYSILGECDYHLKNFEKGRGELLEALNSWDEAEVDKEDLDPNMIRLKAMSTSIFADCFFQDGMWEEAIKYYKKAYIAWHADIPPMSEYNDALARFKESLAYNHLKDTKNSEASLKQALDILHQYPKDFLFCRTEVEMTQLSAKLDQEQGNWLSSTQKFITAGLAKNHPGAKDN